ncbi:phage portal protein [Enterococcus sp. BWB1-3]|uniref:phage portal protein n=1 Tax=Enterococcus sp. BWB1-3 TaxID=2787713 RepID=UPI00192266E2|nr:phage portal protein [Enterococcus sp. BWB1-3]MBL1228756.1 phage portal protein [Enterococcus sp. BWB1-3]
MADVNFTDESMDEAPENGTPIGQATKTGEIAAAVAGEGRRFPFMDSKQAMQRKIREAIQTKKKFSMEGAYKPHRFIVTDDLEKYLKENTGQLSVNHSFGINKYGVYVPFDKKVVKFFASSIKWNVSTSLTYKILKNTLMKGYCLVYSNSGVNKETDFEPIFNTSDEVIALINDDGDILTDGRRYVYEEKKGYVAQEESFSIEWYKLVKIDEMKPVYADAVNLINAYTDSLNDNGSSLKAFAESILTITGIDSSQGITPEQLQAIGEEAINVLAFEHQISGDGTFGSTPSAQFIAPPLNTEAREKWSDRIRKEIYSTLNMPDFEQVAGNVSTDTIRIYLYETIQLAKSLADDVIDVFKEILNTEELSYEIETPQSPNENMKALNDIDYLSDETKIRLAFPEWSDEQVSAELSRLQSAKISDSDPVALVNSFIGSE